MPRFFVAASNIFGGTAYISGIEAEHMRVLRIRRGEKFTICDGAGNDYVCQIEKEEGGGITAEILEKMPSLFLSLAISLRSTFAMPHVLVFAGFTGTELLSLP